MVDIPYTSAIGSLMYHAKCTRSIPAFSVSELSKFIQNFGIAHWEGVKHVLQNVNGIVGVLKTCKGLAGMLESG